MSLRLLLRLEAVYLGLITAALLLMTDCVTWFHTHICIYTHSPPNPQTLSQGFSEWALPSPSTCILFQPKLPAASDSQITVHQEMIAIVGLPPPSYPNTAPQAPCLTLYEILSPLWENYTLQGHHKELLQVFTDGEAKICSAKECGKTHGNQN